MTAFFRKLSLFVLEVKNAIVCDGPCCEEQAVRYHQIRLVEDLAREGHPVAEPDLGQSIQEVLIKVVTDEIGVASVVLAPVHEQELL